MFLTVALISLALVSLIYQLKYNRRNVLLSKIPSPKKKVFSHNALEFYGLNAEEIFDKLLLLHRDLGDVFHVTFHPFDDGIVVIADPDIAETLSNHQPDRSRSIIYKALSRWIGTAGFFLSPEPKLRALMKPINRLFHPKFIERVRRNRRAPNNIYRLKFTCVILVSKSSQHSSDVIHEGR